MPATIDKATQAPTTELQFVSGEAVAIEAAAGESGKLPRFEMVAYNGGTMEPGWGYPVVVEVSGIELLSQRNPVRHQHMVEHGIGHTESVQKVDNRLLASGVISRDTPQAREVVTASKNGFPWQASIGITVKKHVFIDEGAQVEANGQTFEGPLFHVEESLLNELALSSLALTAVRQPRSRRNIVETEICQIMQ